MIRASAGDCCPGMGTKQEGSTVFVIICTKGITSYFQGDVGQTFHSNTVILQMFNYFSNAKDDCKFVVCRVRSYQPPPL